MENSIVHGLTGIRKNCLIRIDVFEDDDFIEIDIFDNGYGISEDKLQKLNHDKKAVGYGMSNALGRLRLTYGEESSVKIESEKGKYTKVIIRFRKKSVI